jgi:hypothetical protein
MADIQDLASAVKAATARLKAVNFQSRAKRGQFFGPR